MEEGEMKAILKRNEKGEVCKLYLLVEEQILDVQPEGAAGLFLRYP
jgi:hypothetical protein